MRTCCISCYLWCGFQAPPRFRRLSGEFAVGGAAQGNALSADLEEENGADKAPQEEEECSLPLLGREETVGAAAASFRDDGEEGTFSASSTENNLFEDGSPLAGIEDRVLIVARTLLSILSESASTTTTTTPAPTAASTFPFEDVEDITLENYVKELVEDNNPFDFHFSDDVLNTTTTTTTTTAPEVKIEVEEPDWNDVHQQGEELGMRPYQRRFKNRPLETRVLLLDPDTLNPSLGDDEAIGREIAVKKELSSEDEEEMGIHWEEAHGISVRALREWSSVEVPDEIKRKGARVGLDSLVVSEPSSSSAPPSSLSSSSSSPSSPSSSSSPSSPSSSSSEEEKRFDSRRESHNIRGKEDEEEKEESSSGAESLVVSSPSNSSEESEYSDDVSPFYIPGHTITIVPSSLETSSDDEYYRRQRRTMKRTAKSRNTSLSNMRGSSKTARDNKRKRERITTSTTTPSPSTTYASTSAAITTLSTIASTATTTTSTTAASTATSMTTTTSAATTTTTAASSSSSATAPSSSAAAPSSPFEREGSNGSKSPEMDVTMEISETGEPLSPPILSGVEEPAEQEAESNPVSSSSESLLSRGTERTPAIPNEEEEERASAESSFESTSPTSVVDVDSNSPTVEGERRRLRSRTSTSTVSPSSKPSTRRRARGTSRSASIDGTWTIGDWMDVREEIEFTNFIVNVILSIERELECSQEEATVRFEHSVMFHFDRTDPHNFSRHPNGSDIRRRAISSTEEEWGAFLVPVENREGPRFRLANLEERWVTFYDIDQKDVTFYLFYDSARRALEISMNYLDFGNNLNRLTEVINTFDHQDERYLCE